MNQRSRYSARLAGWGLIAGIVQIGWFYPRLPKTIAAHFDMWGQPDGWMNKVEFMAFYGGFLLFAIAVLVVLLRGVELEAPQARGFWLEEPGHSDAERQALERVLVRLLYWFGIASLLFLLAMMQLMLQTNETSNPHLDVRTFWIGTTYLIFVRTWFGEILYRCRARVV